MIEVCFEIEPVRAEIAKAIENAANAALKNQGAEGSISFTVTDDETIHELNLQYRNVDRPTDVISFPANEGESVLAPPDGFLGDIVISLPRAEAQAEEYGHSLKREVSFLAVHGTLHLLGYDHMTDEDAKRMFALQDEILDDMGVTR